MKKRILISLIFLSALAFLNGCSAPSKNEPDQVFFNKLRNAAVEILADGRMQTSGSFVTSDGYILTVSHFIPNTSTRLEVLYAGKRVDAELTAIDIGNDIALLKIKTSEELPYLTVSEKQPSVGEDIYVVGSPLYKHILTLHSTIASDKPHYNYLNDQSEYTHIWYVQNMSPRGLSGGCWVNDRGEIVGVQSGFINDQVSGVDGHANSGIAFITDINAIKTLITNKTNTPAPSLGGQLEELWTQSPAFQNRFPAGTEGIVIFKTRENGPLAKAEINHDELIVSINGRKVKYLNTLLDIVKACEPGETVEIEHIKPDDKGSGTKSVTLDCLTQNWLNKDNK